MFPLVLRAQLSLEEQNGIIAAFKDPSSAQVSHPSRHSFEAGLSVGVRTALTRCRLPVTPRSSLTLSTLHLAHSSRHPYSDSTRPTASAPPGRSSSASRPTPAPSTARRPSVRLPPPSHCLHSRH